MSRSEELAISAGEETLVGTLTMPDGDPPGGRARWPWAVLIPSWLPRDRDGAWDRERHPDWFAADARPTGPLARLSAALVRLGVVSFRYDKRGCGASGGRWEEADLFTLIDDARDAVGVMRSRADLDLRRCALLGHGEGATIALSVAIGDPAFSALTLVGAPARGLRDVVRRGVALRDRTGIDRQHRIVAALDRGWEELVERAGRGEQVARLVLAAGAGPVALRLAGWEQAMHTPALALATMLHRSVALVHGADDVWSHPDESRLLAAVLETGGNDPRLELLPGAGHDLAEADDAAIERIAGDLAARIEPRELPPVLLAIEEMGESR